jgi:hypothetical protein
MSCARDTQYARVAVRRSAGGRIRSRTVDINNRGQIVGDYGTKPPLGDSSTSARRLTVAAASGRA